MDAQQWCTSSQAQTRSTRETCTTSWSMAWRFAALHRLRAAEPQHASTSEPVLARRMSCMSTSSSYRWRRACQISSPGRRCHRTRATSSTPTSATTGARSAGCCRPASWTTRTRPQGLSCSPSALAEPHCRRRFSYFIWLNSSARGPFLPPYYAAVTGQASWSRAFTAKLMGSVKLVGSTISCGGGYGFPPVPHVQTYAVATDRKGLEVLLAKVCPCSAFRGVALPGAQARRQASRTTGPVCAL